MVKPRTPLVTVAKDGTLLLSETLFFEADRLALSPAQEIEPGAADMGMTQHFDLFDARRMGRKSPLDAYAVCGDAANSKAGVDRSPPDAHDSAADQLDPLLAALDDAEMHLYVVARPEIGYY